MVEPINPKTILSRSLDVSKLEQSRKAKPNIYQNQLQQELEQKDVRKQDRVNKSEKTEHKKIKKEDDKKEKRRQKRKRRIENGNGDNEEEEGQNEAKVLNAGRYIDIKV
ncbi:hypothetical protein BX659_103174 [Orenia metallireducens]|jgi:Skp family chaperone for outer membrane proteins|uniref:Uncharacterized protein n=1 Tax=Orenia metallireducens TaxID=1413210 RepID=A0A285FNC8_9FIRM|nr:hypothetical protein [Orenia metallireducens]PRX33647.1 hypothetical protein BX659_103174 [Orenia metallireducens]SNY12735.1 hypothetical protein SAMN06265827_102174 [Orenia metallireducens]